MTPATPKALVNIAHKPKLIYRGWLLFERRCPSKNGPGAGALGAGFCAGAMWGERRQSSQQRSVRADHIPFSGAVLFCSLF